MKADEARSDVRRKAVNEWFDDSVVTRLSDQRTGYALCYACTGSIKMTWWATICSSGSDGSCFHFGNCRAGRI